MWSRGCRAGIGVVGLGLGFISSGGQEPCSPTRLGQLQGQAVGW